ncbi:MTOR-associated protein MEAK7 [Hyla sarda]|uniref:MTOR-associated protein MEAK7 n=1 Tax=Hyla sarda TaxID=327740 RepID=UPI0024C32A73|nr:MTOR-associated protein MEAK7 [Hyla sarda]XP_056381457.1 MTOR-associated protein MEAK7 [Hyla sarda]
MGNVESSAYQRRLARVPPADQTKIETSFDSLTRNTSKKCVELKAFQDSIGNSLPSSMSQRIFHGIQTVNITGKAPTSSPEITREQFVVFIIDVLRGTAEEKSAIIMPMISADHNEQVTGQQIQQFLEDLIGATVHVLHHKNMLSGWSLENTRDCNSGIHTLATQLMSQIKDPSGRHPVDAPELSSFSRTVIEDWLYKDPMISTLLRVVVTLGFSILPHNVEHQRDVSSLVPRCRRGKVSSFISLMDLPTIMYLNSHLPSEMQHKWRLLFSTQVHGESFSQLCGHLVDQGPSLLLLRDSGGFIFGAFASQNWEVKPQFQGDNRCFLFTVSPHLEIFTHTGYNDHYMYLNHSQQTMPNGLGLGGQHDYFGLWIDSNFGKGHSRAKPRCTTYNSPQLSSTEEFSLSSMEVWGLGDLSEELQTKNKKSILDADPEAQALLEMTGRTRQSEGLRDNDDET